MPFWPLLVVLLYAVFRRRVASWTRRASDWRSCYKAGPAPPWSNATSQHVCWQGIDDHAWKEVAPSVGIVRLAQNVGAAINLELPDVAEALREKPDVAVAATRVFHLHRMLAAPITPDEAARAALMVFYDADFVTDPERATARVVAAMETTARNSPLLQALDTQLARPLEAPAALRQHETRQAPIPFASGCKTE